MSTPERTRRKRKARREIIVGTFVLDQFEKGTLPEEIHTMLKKDLPVFVSERDLDLFQDLEPDWTPDGN